MRSITVSVLAATQVFAEWQQFPIEVDGLTKTLTYDPTKQNQEAYTSDRGLTVLSNNAVFLKESANDSIDSMFKPDLRGGSVEYDVDLSQQQCGCVAGIYLVKTDVESCNEEAILSGSPQCPTIDVMQANPYGFNVKAHPCNDGQCDPVSQCDLQMKKDGVNKYGEGAYGPNGTIIDSQSEFHIKTEFVSDTDYMTLWKVKTTLTQGDNELMMEADCHDYISTRLNSEIEGNMGFVVSSWDNTAGKEDFECEGMCPTPGNCDNAINTISNFKVWTMGSIENRPEKVYGGPASDVGLCGDTCTACTEYTLSDAPTVINHECTDYTVFKYGNKCKASRFDVSLCGEDDLCHKSYPFGDPDKMKSADMACRPVPKHFQENDFTFGTEATNTASGLCTYGCGENACHKAWISSDTGRWKSASGMYRCKDQ